MHASAPGPAVTVRTATREDAPTIARIRVETWRSAYARLIDPVVLDQLDAPAEGRRRSERWEPLHADPRAADLIAEAGGAPLGWAAYGPSVDTDLPHDGQLFALYALPDAWGTGVGHALIAETERRLRRAGFSRAHLWVLDGNARAADFYERHGWTEDGAVMTDDRVIGGHTAFTLFERRRVRDLRQPPPSR